MRFVLLLSLLLSTRFVVAEAIPTHMVEIASGVLLPFFQDVSQQNGGKQSVQVPGFLMDQFAVTNAQYLRFVRQRPQWTRSRAKRLFTDTGYLAHWTSDDGFAPQNARSPVTHVSWFAARAYCAHLDKRLPTINEWELVARASEAAPDATTDQEFQQRILQWYGTPTPKSIGSVGSIYRNVYGVYDMHGLIWEWTQDFNSVLMTGESRADTGLERQLFCAGGSVGAVNLEDYSAFMRYAFRASLQAKYTVGNLGFRCVKERSDAQ
jgi:formylglycine-generating enzyme